LKRLTFLLQNPQCCFVYYLVFKDQAACRSGLRNLPEPGQPVKNLFQGFFRKADSFEMARREESRTVRYLSPLPFSCRSVFGCKELPCEVKLYNKTVSCRQSFSFEPGAFFFEKRAVRQRGVFITKPSPCVNVFIISFYQ